MHVEVAGEEVMQALKTTTGGSGFECASEKE